MREPQPAGDRCGRTPRNVDIVESRRNGPQLSMRHDDDGICALWVHFLVLKVFFLFTVCGLRDQRYSCSNYGLYLIYTMYVNAWCQGRSDGGGYRYLYPPNQPK